MSQYRDDAVFVSPFVLVRVRRDQTGAQRRAIRELFRRAVDAFPNLRFEIADVTERPYGVIVIYRKLGVFAGQPGEEGMAR